MVRALHRSILGRSCGASFCSSKVQRTPRRPRSMASVRPPGPAPTTMTSLSNSAKLRFRFHRRAAQKFLRRHRLFSGALHLRKPPRAAAPGEGWMLVEQRAGRAAALAFGRAQRFDAHATGLEPGTGKRRQPADLVVHLNPGLAPIDMSIVLP